jgi:hypothetical protein
MKELEEEFPRFRLVPKAESTFSKVIDVALRVVTLGRQNRYMTEYHTVIGDTLYLPSAWHRSGPLERLILLRHERIHLRQKRRLGMLLMALVYLVPLFPLGLAYGRARLEWEAYEETLRATAEFRGWEAAADPLLRARIIERFTGADYGWMWPFRRHVERWYESALREIRGQYRPENQGFGPPTLDEARPPRRDTSRSE